MTASERRVTMELVAREWACDDVRAFQGSTRALWAERLAASRADVASVPDAELAFYAVGSEHLPEGMAKSLRRKFKLRVH